MRLTHAHHLPLACRWMAIVRDDLVKRQTKGIDMEESCMTCDNGNGVGGCAYPICCIQFSEWKPIPIKMEWEKINDKARSGDWILVFYATDLMDSQSHFAVTRFVDNEWVCDEGDKNMDEADFWMPLPQPPAGSP